MPPRPRAPMETLSFVGCAVLIRWKIEKRRARCASSSPSTTRSASRQRSRHAAA